MAKFDDMDHNVFSNQDWVRLHESHAEDVVVHWPNGRETRGLKRHADDLRAMFVYAPDTRIKEHPVKIANNEWTSVIGIMEAGMVEQRNHCGIETIKAGAMSKFLQCELPLHAAR